MALHPANVEEVCMASEHGMQRAKLTSMFTKLALTYVQLPS
jgi:hypothetical protein